MPFLAPLITSIGGVLSGAASFLNSGTMLAGIARLGLGMAAQYAIGQLVKRNVPPQVTQLQTQYGEGLPRTVVLGKRGIAGHHIYRNAFGKGNRTVQDVFVLSHFRINGVTRVRYKGEWKALGGTEDVQRGFRIQNIDAEIWVKVYKGSLSQAADAGLIAKSNPSGRWTSSHRLAGLAYSVVTQQLDREKLPSPWEAFFEVEGLCYDWRYDASAGGSGNQRWNDPTTWAPSANPIVQAYNLERGFWLNNQLIVGKGASSDRLPLAQWTLAANISDENVDGGRRYTSAYLASAGQGTAHADNLGPVLAAAAASWYEGSEGEYPIAGAVQAVVATITDDDLLIDEDERLSLKRTRSELVNTIAGSYSEPTNFYDSVPLATRTDAVAFAADRERLAASVPYEAVVDAKVGDRLNDIALRASRYQANAEICLRPKFLGLRVGQWIRWQSRKAGGFDKTFQIVRRRLGPLGPKACRAVYVTLQEVGDGIFDPTAYTTLPPDTSGVGAPDYQSELDNFQVLGISNTSSTGSKRAGIRASWNTIEDLTITFVDLEYGPIDASGQVPAAVVTKSAKANQAKEDLFEGVMGASLWAVRYTLRSEPPRTFFASPWFEAETPRAPITDVSVYLDGIGQDVYQTIRQLRADHDTLRDRLEILAAGTADATGASVDRHTVARRFQNATAVALREMTASVEATEAGLVAQAAILDAVAAQVGNVSADGLRKIMVTAGAGDVVARLTDMVRATIDDDWVEAGTVTEVGFTGGDPSNPFSRIVQYAGQHVFADQNGQWPPIVFDETGTGWFNAARIKDLTADNIKAKSLDADAVLQNGTLLTEIMAFDAITDKANNSFSKPDTTLTSAYTPYNVWRDEAIVTIDNPNPNPILISFSLRAYGLVPSGSGRAMSGAVRLVRVVDAVTYEIDRAAVFWNSNQSGADERKNQFYIDPDSPQGISTYRLQSSCDSNFPSNAFGASGRIACLWWKR